MGQATTRAMHAMTDNVESRLATGQDTPKQNNIA